MVKKARIERINPKKLKLIHFQGNWKAWFVGSVEVVRGSDDLWRSAFLRFCFCSDSSISSWPMTLARSILRAMAMERANPRI